MARTALIAATAFSLLVQTCLVGCSKDDPNGPSPNPRRTLAFALQPGISTSNLYSLASADFNGDGIRDLVAASSDSLLLYVLSGRGDGTFELDGRFQTPFGSAPDILTGDFDSDGNADVACNTSGVPRTVILFGNGDRTFVVQPIYGDNGTFTQGQVAVGDFDGNGIDDFASVRQDSIAVLLGNGTRNLSRIVSYTPSGPITNGAVKSTAADFNGDGKLDFAVPRISENRVAVYYGWGDGTFQTPIMLASTGWDYRSCAIKPVPSRVGMDLAVTHAIDARVGVFRRSAGTFLPESTYSAGSNPGSVGTADFDLDGIDDLIVSSGGANSAAVLRGKADGQFEPAAFFNAGSSPDHLIVGDYDRDGRPDAAFSGFRAIYVLLNRSQ